MCSRAKYIINHINVHFKSLTILSTFFKHLFILISKLNMSIFINIWNPYHWKCAFLDLSTLNRYEIVNHFKLRYCVVNRWTREKLHFDHVKNLLFETKSNGDFAKSGNETHILVAKCIFFYNASMSICLLTPLYLVTHCIHIEF
jgi:hypothetical protein